MLRWMAHLLGRKLVHMLKLRVLKEKRSADYALLLVRTMGEI